MSAPIMSSLAVMALLLAAPALAAPNKVQRDATGVQHVGALVTPPPSGAADSAAAGADYDFAGVLFQASTAETFTSVTATFTIPTPAVPSASPSASNYFMSPWIGICQRGYAANEGLLQTGCDVNTQKTLNGHAYQCWVEYFPAPAQFIDMYPIPGDHIVVGVKGLSPTSGVVSIKNLNGTATFTSTMTAPTAVNTILGPGNLAAYVLETTPTPTLPSFKPAITFTNANTYNKAGKLVPIANSGGIEVERNGNDETRSSFTGNQVVIQYLHS